MSIKVLHLTAKSVTPVVVMLLSSGSLVVMSQMTQGSVIHVF